MQEIDIIELLQRVKEGKAPKKIQVGNFIYSWHTEVEGYFRSVIDNNYISVTADFDIFNILDTKIKILDKPIIEELEISRDVFGKNPILIKKDGKANTLRTIDAEIIDKINEIIDFINNKE